MRRRQDAYLHKTDIDSWRITFVGTRLRSNIGQRLLRVRRYLEVEEEFRANYYDGLSDLPLDELIADYRRRRAVVTIASARSLESQYAVHASPDGWVAAVRSLRVSVRSGRNEYHS